MFSVSSWDDVKHSCSQRLSSALSCGHVTTCNSLPFLCKVQPHQNSSSSGPFGPEHTVFPQLGMFLHKTSWLPHHHLKLTFSATWSKVNPSSAAFHPSYTTVFLNSIYYPTGTYYNPGPCFSVLFYLPLGQDGFPGLEPHA